MSTTKTNSILEAVKKQYELNKSKEKKKKFTKEERDNLFKKYFNIINEGDYSFRILPVKDGESPFLEAYFHHLKVNGVFSKLYCPQKNDDKKCPICEAEEALKATKKDEDFILSREYQAKLFYIIKGIDRNKVSDGVKFWRFKHNYKQQGIYDKLVPVFAKKGDITDPIEGRDLIISATIITEKNKRQYTTVSSIMPDDKSRLTDDDNLLKELVNDGLTWRDVFKSKTVEYLQAVVEGKAPYWDDTQKKMVTPTGKKTIKAVVDDNTETTDDVDNENGNGIDFDVPTAIKTPAVMKNKEVNKTIKKQTADIFETETVSDEDPDDDGLPF